MREKCENLLLLSDNIDSTFYDKKQNKNKIDKVYGMIHFLFALSYRSSGKKSIKILVLTE